VSHRCAWGDRTLANPRVPCIITAHGCAPLCSRFHYPGRYPGLEIELDRMTADERPPMEYLKAIPRAVPPGKVLVHNRVPRDLGEPGAGPERLPLLAVRAVGARWEPCDCGWAPNLPEHHRTREA
jgi:hypothetical protein